MFMPHKHKSWICNRSLLELGPFGFECQGRGFEGLGLEGCKIEVQPTTLHLRFSRPSGLRSSKRQIVSTACAPARSVTKSGNDVGFAE